MNEMDINGADETSIEAIEEAVLEVIDEASAALAALAGTSAIESELFAHAAAHLDAADEAAREQVLGLVTGLEEMFSTLRIAAQAQESLYEGLGSLNEAELRSVGASAAVLPPIDAQEVWDGLPTTVEMAESLLDPCGPDCTCEGPEDDVDDALDECDVPEDVDDQTPAEAENEPGPALDLELAEEVKSRLRARAGAEVIARALALVAGGASTAEAAVEAGVSTSTISRWTLTATEVVDERAGDDEEQVDPGADEQLVIDFDPEFDEPVHEVDVDEGPGV